MNHDSWNDVVMFELAEPGLAESLARRLRPSWIAWSEPHDFGWAVGVELPPVGDDLAALMRDVATWVGECSLRGVGFELDGRVYTLWAADVAAEVA